MAGLPPSPEEIFDLVTGGLQHIQNVAMVIRKKLTQVLWIHGPPTSEVI
jgi:hypothetical protein